MFKEAGVIERYGSGIGRIIAEFKAYGLAAPEFKEAGESFLVTVYKARISGFTQKTFQKSSEKGSGKSSEKILALIATKPLTSAVEIAAEIGLTSRAVEKTLADLKATGKIKRVGSDKGGHWEVLSK